MARPGSVPITRLRFRGRTGTLNALCRAFREHPRQALTANDLVDYTGLQFRDVYQRLTETPELFLMLRKKKVNTNARYRLRVAVERMSEEETRVFINEQTRAETRLAVGVVSAILVIGAVAGYLSAKY
jgi:hypothetical protein